MGSRGRFVRGEGTRAWRVVEVTERLRTLSDRGRPWSVLGEGGSGSDHNRITPAAVLRIDQRAVKKKQEAC